MNADAIIPLIGYGVLVPAAASLGLRSGTRALLRGDASARYPATLGFVGGFCIGYLLLSDWSDWRPTRHWQWLPYLAVAAGVLGPLGHAKGVSRPERVVLNLLLAITAAWFLVPTWSSLDPPRAIWMLALAGLLCLSVTLLDPLVERLGSTPVMLALCAASLAVTVLVGLCVSVTYAQFAGVATGSLAGVCIGNWRCADDSGVRALLPAAIVVVGGIAFIGCVEPQPPLYGLLGLPAAPLGLWLSRIGPFKNFSGRTTAAVQAAGVGMALLVAAAQTLFAD